MLGGFTAGEREGDLNTAPAGVHRVYRFEANSIPVAGNRVDFLFHISSSEAVDTARQQQLLLSQTDGIWTRERTSSGWGEWRRLAFSTELVQRSYFATDVPLPAHTGSLGMAAQGFKGGPPNGRLTAAANGNGPNVDGWGPVNLVLVKDVEPSGTAGGTVPGLYRLVQSGDATRPWILEWVPDQPFNIEGTVVAVMRGTVNALSFWMWSGGFTGSGANGKWEQMLADTGSVNLTLNAPWAAYGGEFRIPFYRRIGKVVYLGGLLNPTAAVAANGVIATLPVGFRPTARRLYAALSNVATSGQVRVDVTSTGAIVIGAALGAGAWTSLDGMHFDVA